MFPLTAVLATETVRPPLVTAVTYQGVIALPGLLPTPWESPFPLTNHPGWTDVGSGTSKWSVAICPRSVPVTVVTFPVSGSPSVLLSTDSPIGSKTWKVLLVPVNVIAGREIGCAAPVPGLTPDVCGKGTDAE